MTLASAIQKLREDPDEELGAPCCLRLQGYLSGYSQTDKSARAVIRAITPSLAGPAEADLCSRALLSCPTSAAAFELVLSTLEAECSKRAPLPAQEFGAFGRHGFLDELLEVAPTGRYGVLLGDTTVLLADASVRGNLRALASLDPEQYRRERERLRRFETWLSRGLGTEVVPWAHVVWASAGGSTSGVEWLVQQWSEFNAGRSEPPD